MDIFQFFLRYKFIKNEQMLISLKYQSCELLLIDSLV
jgi:hypothetical protein